MTAATGLAGLYRAVRSPAAMRPYASVAEQILLSGVNLAISLVVVRSGGVAALGVYSFFFVLCSLANGVYATLLHRQMMLAAAPRDESGANEVFRTTATLEMVLSGAVLALALTAALAVQPPADLATWRTAAVCAVVYLVAYNAFDLFRQFLYTRDDQVASLGYTIVYGVAQMIALAVVLVGIDGPATVAAVYAGSALSHALAIGVNRTCWRALGRAGGRGAGRARALLHEYFEHARFGLLGMLVTWLQNQSMNPFLMYAGGATVAGYFSLARLLVMPVAVISQGLVNSSTPRLRRAFESDGQAAVEASSHSLRQANLGVWAGWTLILLVADLSGLAARFVPHYEDVRPFLALWVVLLLASMYRFWTGQLFVVAMRFRYMLRVGLVATAVSVTGMLVLGLGFDAIRAALWFAVVGEVVTLAMFARGRRVGVHAI